MKKQLIFIFIMFCFLIVACSVPATNETTLTPTVQTLMVESIATTTPTITFTSSTTPEPTLTSTYLPTTNPTSTSTVTPDPRVKTMCLDVISDQPSDFKAMGTLILISAPSIIPANVPEFLDLATGAYQSLPKSEDEQLLGFRVSPDNQYLAYQRVVLDSNIPTERWLIITNSDGQQLKEIPFLGSAGGIAKEDGDWLNYSWLDSKTLVIETYSSDETERMLLLDPFSGKQQVIETWGDYYDPLNGWEGKIFDSRLTRMVYPGLTNNFENSIVLWDITTQQVVVNIPTNIDANYLGRPAWSPDDEQFAVSLSVEYHLGDPIRQELYTINKDGNITRMTYLTDIHDEVDMGSFSWSPDGSNVAFWWDAKSSAGARLAVVNTLTGEFTNYCIPIGVGFSTGPYWSPDGQQILTGYYDNETQKWVVVLVDIFNGYAIQIAEDMIPAGWMISPQE